MTFLSQLRKALDRRFRRRRREADLESEFRDHFEHEVEHNRRAGMSPEEARFAAQRLIGPISLYQEECRDVHGGQFLENFARDLHYALRSVRNNAAFSLATVVALTLGIGVSTAIYSLAHTVVFAPLPFLNANRLVQIQTASSKTGHPETWVSYADLADWKTRNRTFESIGAYRFALLDLPGDPPLALYGVGVTHDLFPTLGVKPALGRNFLPQEDRPGHGQEIILSDSLWRSRFAADPQLLGKTIRLVGQRESDEYVVVGIMPGGFNFPLTIPNSVTPPTRQMAYWIPLAKQPLRTSPVYVIPVGRLRPGISLAQAQTDLASVAVQLERQYPDTNTGLTVHLAFLKDLILGRSKVAFTLLLGAIGTIFAIVCANLAHLLLARVFSRTRESGLRLALGASRFRLLQQWLAESLLLSLIGSFGALVIAKSGPPNSAAASTPSRPPDRGDAHRCASISLRGAYLSPWRINGWSSSRARGGTDRCSRGALKRGNPRHNSSWPCQIARHLDGDGSLPGCGSRIGSRSTDQELLASDQRRSGVLTGPRCHGCDSPGGPALSRPALSHGFYAQAD